MLLYNFLYPGILMVNYLPVRLCVFIFLSLYWAAKSKLLTMSKLKTQALTAACAVVLFSSCTTYQRTMTDSNSRVNFTSKDFTITPAYGGYAQQTRIIGIDWARLFRHKEGEITNSMGMGASSFSIPVIGSVLNPTSVDAYALYDLMKAHPNYDAVFYPQFKRKHFNFLGIYSHTKVEVKARLGKLEAGTGEGDNTDDK